MPREAVQRQQRAAGEQAHAGKVYPHPPRPGGDVSGSLSAHAFASRDSSVVPTGSDDVNAVPIGSIGDGAKGGNLGAQHLGSKLQPGVGRSRNVSPARTVARDGISEATRPPLAHGDKLTVGGTKSDGLGT